jgi:hypothetical protein
MGAKATTRTKGRQERPRQEHNVTQPTPGELKLSDIQVTKTAKRGELTGKAPLACTPSPALECDRWVVPLADSVLDVAESLVPCSTVRVRSVRTRARKCELGNHFTCCSSRPG